MQELDIKKITNTLRKRLAGNIVDIFIIGSSLKNKLKPNDLDVVVLFDKRNKDSVEESLISVREDLGSLGFSEIHIEHLFLDNFMKESLFFTIFHEGYSVKYQKKIQELQDFNSYSLFIYSLSNLKKKEKIKFSHAIYGRKKNGLLFAEHGKTIGAGSFIIPVEKEEIMKEAMDRWNIKYTLLRTIIKE